ncbi:MAG: hypothetical protein KIT87_26050, partial [Anaerolineae bacterium]|nr:hypothetical protein [Anaerolineae bacterium]
MSAKYAKRMVADGGWTYCSGANTNETPTLFFPFLKTCPRCSVKRGIKPSVKANKPQSDLIGEMAVDSTILVLAALLHSIDPRVVVQKSNVRQGDVDMVIYDNDMIVLGEVKSSPLVVYPLEIQLARPMTEVIDGQPSSKPDHSKATTQVDMGNIALYIPHIDLHIPLGPYDGQWPYPRLIEFVRDPQNVAVLISAWNDLYETYVAPRQGKRGRQDEEHLRWLRCGCGGGVDDSKNAPGLDRTDDIKKGTYQVLKFGTYYKEQCPKRL